MSGAATLALGKYGPIEVFRAGEFFAMGGSKQTITEGNLHEIASDYDPEAAPAPVVIGHPATDAPAFGWVDKLYVEGGILKATLADTVAEFADMVKAGRYKRVSISLFLPNSPANPKPGSLYLKHVGFLGATAPAVPGLKPVKFAGTASDAMAYEQDRVPADFAANDELARLRRQVREQEVENLIGQGRVLPTFKDEIIAFAVSLDDSETVSFSEGGAAVTRKDWFLSYLARQPKVVSFGEFDLGADPLEPSSAPRQNIPDGFSADPRQAALAAKAEELARSKGISFAAAVDMLSPGRR